MKIFSRFFLIASIFYALCVLLFIAVKTTTATAAIDNSNVVISQIQVLGSAGAHQEFVELYNPTLNTIDMNNWELAKKTANGTTLFPLVATISAMIKPHGYFLIAPTDYVNATISADLTYTASGNSTITNDNTIILFSDNGQTRVDTVGMETNLDNQDNEASAAANPTNNKSIIRKASVGSTPSSLLPNGAEGQAGNGFDTDNNFNDFVTLSSAMPRNSNSPQEPPIPTIIPTSIPSPTPTNTPTPTVTPTPLPTATPTPSPTVTPSPTPTTTPTPSPRPTATPTPTQIPTQIPTTTPTQTPTVTPKPTATPTPTVNPTLVPTVTPTPTQPILPTPTVTPTKPPTKVIINEPISSRIRLVCTETFHIIKIFGIHISIPYIKCEKIRI